MMEDRLDLLDHLVELSRVLVRISEDIECLRGVTLNANQRMLGRALVVQVEECLAMARQCFGE